MNLYSLLVVWRWAHNQTNLLPSNYDKRFHTFVNVRQVLLLASSVSLLPISFLCHQWSGRDHKLCFSLWCIFMKNSDGWTKEEKMTKKTYWNISRTNLLKSFVFRLSLRLTFSSGSRLVYTRFSRSFCREYHFDETMECMARAGNKLSATEFRISFFLHRLGHDDQKCEFKSPVYCLNVGRMLCLTSAWKIRFSLRSLFFLLREKKLLACDEGIFDIHIFFIDWNVGR